MFLLLNILIACGDKDTTAQSSPKEPIKTTASASPTPDQQESKEVPSPKKKPDTPPEKVSKTEEKKAPLQMVSRSQKQGLFGSDTTDELSVLDINSTFAAVKLVYHNEGDEMLRLPKNCNYSGMQKTPTSGVSLYLVDLQKGNVEEFEVYKFTFDNEKCSTPEESDANLQKAKDAFQKAGLDITRKPTPDVTATDKSIAWGPRPLNIRTSVKNNDEEMTGYATGELLSGSDVVYRTKRSFSLAMAGFGKVSFQEGYVTPAGLVVLEKMYSFRADGSGEHYRYALTPPIQGSR